MIGTYPETIVSLDQRIFQMETQSSKMRGWTFDDPWKEFFRSIQDEIGNVAAKRVFMPADTPEYSTLLEYTARLEKIASDAIEDLINEAGADRIRAMSIDDLVSFKEAILAHCTRRSDQDVADLQHEMDEAKAGHVRVVCDMALNSTPKITDPERKLRFVNAEWPFRMSAHAFVQPSVEQELTTIGHEFGTVHSRMLAVARKACQKFTEMTDHPARTEREQKKNPAKPTSRER